MKIMTFNTQHCLNYVQRVIDLPLMAKVIRDCDPDVVGLNEMYGQGTAPNYTDQTGELAKLTDMHHYFAQAIGYDGVKPYGNGLLSKLPILKAETILIPDPVERNGTRNYETRCVLKATLEGGITVLVTHMGLNAEEKQLAIQTVLEHVAPEKCIVMGDFNIHHDDPQLQPIRDRLKDVTDAVGSIEFTFPSYGPTIKIDYIFVTPDVQVISAEVPKILASDHYPHTAVVDL